MINEHMSKEITDAVKALFDLTARIDERVKMLIDSNERLHDLINDVEEKVRLSTEQRLVTTELRFSDLKAEIQSLKHDIRSEVDGVAENLETTQDDLRDVEKRVSFVEQSSSKQEGNWKVIISYVIQGAFILIICWLLAKLGLQTPPMP